MADTKKVVRIQNGYQPEASADQGDEALTPPKTSGAAGVPVSAEELESEQAK